MTHSTMTYGIDLGTTTSIVGRREGVDAEIIKNNENGEITPSAVWIDAKGALHIGAAAKKRAATDPENAYTEFKLRMGTNDETLFVASGRRMKPEELSAEVLKALRASVRARTGEELDAAVITVPAAFAKHQIEATNRAAQLAGLRHTTLLQEPTAAAQAYAAKSAADNVFWLVYDFGGGTFDAAIVRLKDGLFSVVNHRGDGHLGGKLIDWAIVDELLIPALVAQHGLRDVRRDNPRWHVPIAKLKLLAEEGKIALSSAAGDSTMLEAESLFKDDAGRAVEFQHELRRADVERLAEPLVTRSIELCRKALQEKGLGAEAIDRVLLVGGTTLVPYVRERLADADRGLGRPLGYDIDPVTVVARGATIFAGTVKIPAPAGPPPAAGELTLTLDYDEVGPDSEPFVAGTLVRHGSTRGVGGFTIEFVNAGLKEPWRSGAVSVGADGRFATALWAEGKGTQNWFDIELRDGAGTPQVVRPARISYTITPGEQEPLLAMGIGVRLADNKMLWLAERQTPLPVKRKRHLVTTVAIRKGEAGAMIRIPVMEGEHDRADRNRTIGVLEIKATNVRRDVPQGAAIDLEVAIDRSQLIDATAYVDILDEEFRKPMHVGDVALPSAAVVAEQVRHAAERLEKLRQDAEETGSQSAREEIERIDRERLVTDLERDVAGRGADPDALIATDQKLPDLRAALDKVDDALKWPLLQQRAESVIDSAHGVLDARGAENRRAELDRLEAELRDGLARRDEDVVEQRLQTIERIMIQVLGPALLVPQWFGELRELRGEMRDQAEAARLIAEGDRALQNADTERLRLVCARLAQQLPVPPPPPDHSDVAGG